MEILQELTVERVAFDARMGLTNGIAEYPLENIRVDITIRDLNGNIKNDLFFVRPPILAGISGTMDGTGLVPASSKGESHWLIIPSVGAGYVMMDGALKQVGVEYLVGATLSYTVNGVKEVVSVNPAKITVKPMPQLVLDYFTPYKVLGDNPFTSQVEAPVPYPLAVRVLNDGYGQAANLKIDSAQPKILDNKQGLLVSFRILGASVNDSPVSPSLTVNFGNLPSKKVATASWEMISTLSGTFTEFKTSVSHSSELGGELTSLVKEPQSHYLTHMVKVNLPGRDGRLDFLADVNDTSGTIYESEIPAGSSDMADASSRVTVISTLESPARPTPTKAQVTLKLPTGTAGWVYTKLPDPSLGMLKLLGVARGDGVALDPHNFWIDQGLDANYKKTWTLQLVDYRPDANATGSYTLNYTTPDVDATAPTTAIIFDGPSNGSDPAFVTPQTRLILSASDNDGGSGVDGMFKKVAGVDTDFVPALPFNLTEPGTYTLAYYSTDLAGNVETAKGASVTVVSAAPAISSFTVTPSTFAPQAPRGVAAARVVDFKLTANSTVSALPVEIAISQGDTFNADQVVRTLKGSAIPGTELRLTWDGKDATGKMLPLGTFSAQVKVSDGLDNPADANAPKHTTTAATTVAIADWLNAAPVDPHPEADQMHARVSGSKIVWQDMRNGKWDIYLKDTVTGVSRLVLGTSPDRERPAVDGNVVVWQDYRNGNWDIFGYDLGTATEIPIATAAGDQTRPVIAGNWVAWQDNRDGNWDIYAYDLTTQETLRVTSHERDQLNPSLSASGLAWEDYRHGLAEIYRYDLSTRTETLASAGPVDEAFPVLSGDALVWSDRRSGQGDLYRNDPVKGALRITYGAGDHGQPALLNDLLVYTDYESGADDPNLSFRSLASGTGDRLVADPSRQEEPALGPNLVTWQDSRDGKYQIYAAPFATEPLPIEAQIKPGFNLVAVGDALAGQNAAALVAAGGPGFQIERLLKHDPLHNIYTEATATGGDFILAKGTGVVLYAKSSGTLKLAESGDSATYTLLPGTNHVGLLTIPSGYSAYDLMTSLGLENVQSLRRFDGTTGAWQTVSVRSSAGKNALVGSNFTIQPGDGVVLTMKNRVDGWQP